MNKGKKIMKKNKEAKFKVKGPEAIEDGLMDMGRAIEAGGPWTHPEMERIPEWRGADIWIASDFETDLVPFHRPRPIRFSRPAEGMRYAPEFNDPNYFDRDLTVRTMNAGAARWFVFQIRDLFDGLQRQSTRRKWILRHPECQYGDEKSSKSRPLRLKC